MGFVGVVLLIGLGFLVYIFVAAGIAKLMQNYPILQWVFTGIVFLILLSFHWIAALIGTPIVFGILESWKNDGDKCCHCGSFRTKEIHDDPRSKMRIWECKECSGTTVECKTSIVCPHCNSGNYKYIWQDDLFVVQCDDCKQPISWFKPNKL